MEEKEEETLRITAMDFAMRVHFTKAEDVLALAKLIYDFLKSGAAPQKDHDDAKLQ